MQLACLFEYSGLEARYASNLSKSRQTELRTRNVYKLFSRRTRVIYSHVVCVQQRPKRARFFYDREGPGDSNLEASSGI